MKRKITGYHLDRSGDWVAELCCDHFQHVRHNPPWMNRVWVRTQSGRDSKLGAQLNCVKCDANAPPDKQVS